jgi:hypothetical protein
MTEEFHRTRPKIFRFAVTKAPPERVAMDGGLSIATNQALHYEQYPCFLSHHRASR